MSQSPLLRLALALLVLLVGWQLAGPGTVAAQDDQPAATEQPATPAPAPDAAAADSAAKPKLIKHIVESVGPLFGLLMLGISIALVTVIVLLAMDLRLATSTPPAFVDEFTETVNKRRFKEAYELARGDTSFLARVLSAGMARLQYGLEDAREAAQNMVESVKAGKEQLIAYLATVGTLGPMIGLVGTVYGMIQSFMVMATHDTPKPSQLAGGISHALGVTLLGIGISVPAIFCHTFFKNRLTRISLDTSNLADELLTQMYHNSRKPAAEPPRAAPAPAPAAPATPAPAAKTAAP